MAPSRKIILQQHKLPISEGLALALKLLDEPDEQFQYRLNLLIKIIEDLAERSRALRDPLVWLKLKYIQTKLIPTAKKEGSWCPGNLEELKCGLLFIRQKVGEHKVLIQFERLTSSMPESVSPELDLATEDLTKKQALFNKIDAISKLAQGVTNPRTFLEQIQIARDVSYDDDVQFTDLRRQILKSLADNIDACGRNIRPRSGKLESLVRNLQRISRLGEDFSNREILLHFHNVCTEIQEHMSKLFVDQDLNIL